MNDDQNTIEIHRENFSHGWAPALGHALQIQKQALNSSEQILEKIQQLQITFDGLIAEVMAGDEKNSAQKVMTSALQASLTHMQALSAQLIHEQRGGLERLLQSYITNTDKHTRQMVERAHDDFILRGKREVDVLRSHLAQESEELKQVIAALVKHGKELDQQRALLMGRERRLLNVLEESWLGRLTWLITGRHLLQRMTNPDAPNAHPRGAPRSAAPVANRQVMPPTPAKRAT
jgi:hypothetical protein